jgi:uncharacterized protein YjdB
MKALTCISIALCVAAVVACDTNVTGTAVVAGQTPGANTPLTITPNQVTLALGATQQFATNAPAGTELQLQWRSSQPGVALVNTTGVVTARAAGVTTITVRFTSDTTNVGSATVTVNP